MYVLIMIFKFSKAANLFEILILYCFLTSGTLDFIPKRTQP